LLIASIIIAIVVLIVGFHAKKKGSGKFRDAGPIMMMVGGGYLLLMALIAGANNPHALVGMLSAIK
jgi:hypothetical protein